MYKRVSVFHFTSYIKFHQGNLKCTSMKYENKREKYDKEDIV